MNRIVVAAALVSCTLAASAAASAVAGTRQHAGDEPGGVVEIVFTGTVYDATTGGRLSGAQVQLEGTTRGAVTGATGGYRFVLPGSSTSMSTARLIAQRAGYRTATLTVAVRGEAVTTDFHLRPQTAELQEIVATSAERALGDTWNRAAPLPASAPGFAAGAVAGVSPAAPPPQWNREGYRYVAENAFLAASVNPLSTFSIDVDRASYSNVRRFLLDRTLPPADAVRIEEMVNYFPYETPRPGGEHPFAVAAEIAAAPWQPAHRLLRITLASQPFDNSRLPASNLVFLIDVSGSMSSPDKLPLVKQSLRLLVNELREQDHVAIVVYAGAAGLVLPSTSGDQRERILDAIERLEAGGSTAGGAGLRLAYRVAGENRIEGGNNRVVLATDGDFNVGESSDAEMVRLIQEMRRGGTQLTVLGFGTGNLQDAKMEQIADHGNGNYAYIDSLLEARKVLVEEMGGTLSTVARDVKLQVEFNPALVRGYRLVGYENRLLAAEDFNDDGKDAGELGAGHTVTALYEIVPVGVETDAPIRGVDPLRYQDGSATVGRGGTDEVAFVRVRYKPPTGERSLLLEQAVRDRGGPPSADQQFAAAVAGFGMLLRQSEHRGAITPDRVIELARAGSGRDPGGHREEFIRLVQTYRSIAGSER